MISKLGVILGVIFNLSIFCVSSASTRKSPSEDLMGSIQQKRSIQVTGECSLKSKADRGKISVSVRHIEKTIQMAYEKTEKKYSRFRKDVKGLSLKDLELETKSFTVNEHKVWENQKQISKGFRAQMSLQVSTSEIKRLGDVIAIAAKHGIKSVGRMTTFVSTEKNRSERESCLTKAIENAQTKAKKLAEAVGAKIGKALTIFEVGNHAPPVTPHYPMMKSAAMESSLSSPPIDASKEEIKVFVRTHFEIL